MDADRLGTSHHRLTSARRPLVGRGIGALLALTRSATGEGKKKKKKKAPTCPEPEMCPAGCLSAFSGYNVSAGTGIFCGGSLGLQRVGPTQQCVPCSNSNPCVSADFPNCVNSHTNLITNQTTYFTGICGPYAEGVCAIVSACINPD